MEKFGPWDTCCAMVDVLETRFPTGDDFSEKARSFLSEANPHVWQGEVSGDPATNCYSRPASLSAAAGLLAFYLGFF